MSDGLSGDPVCSAPLNTNHMSHELSTIYNISEHYLEELYLLQVELLKLQKHISDKKKRLAIFFEGRDTAGKGRAIFRFTQFLNPQGYRVVAMGKPSDREAGQWYFQRYLSRMPNPGEIVLFDRSWYNRAVVEPVMNFCTPKQYKLFMGQVNHIEQFLIEDGIHMVKYWFSIDPEEQKKRIERRLSTELIRWKVSPVDLAAQEKWEDFTSYKTRMFETTSTSHSPWIVIKSPEREDARIQAMRYVLSLFDYPDKSSEINPPDSSRLFAWPESPER